MNANLNNTMTSPSIEYVPLTYKQKFKDSGISKNTMSFTRIEDMIVMCLSKFVHDYVHDYNLGSMHVRVIKGNISRSELNPEEPSLFEKLGITVGNTILKKFKYGVGVRGDISMYNDNQYQEVSTNDRQKQSFYNYLNKNEERIEGLSGGETTKLTGYIDEANNDDDNTDIESIDSDTDKIDNTDIESIGSDTEEIDVGNDNIQMPVEEDKTGTYIKPSLAKESGIAETPLITNEDITSNITTFNDVKSILFIPSIISSLNIEQIVSTLEKNADFLSFHSSLNTFVVTYLGYDVNKSNELDEINNEKYKLADKAIKASLNYIINDLKDQKNSMDIKFYGDIFSLLLDSYEIITNKKTGENENPFDILNSPEILYQFIIFYVSYITVESYDKFKEMISQMSGGSPDEEEEIELEENIDGDEEPQSKSAESDVSESELLPGKQIQEQETPEYVFITHNNLLTTIARGMFIKLGIWKRIFFPDKPIEDITPNDYIFGPNEINEITYNKLLKLFPIEPEVISSSSSSTLSTRGHPNNELLILEILILKRLLVEMSPSKTLTFGSGIDDELKNYMDAFYFYNYDMYKVNETVNELIPDNVKDNPNFLEDMKEQEQEYEEFFRMCEEDCDPDKSDSGDGSYQMEGGDSKNNDKDTSGDIELTEIKRPATTFPVEFNNSVEKAQRDLNDTKQDLARLINKTSLESLSADAEPMSADAEPISTDASPISTDASPISIDASPISIDVEPISTDVEPISTDVEPISTDVARGKNPDVDIIEQPRPLPIPVLFNKLKKMYQNNMFTIKQLQDSKIEPITIPENGLKITNLFELLNLNEVLIHKDNSSINMPAPKYKFIINNAANIGSNLNGSRMFIPKKFVEIITATINEIKQNVYDGNEVNEQKLKDYTESTVTELDNKYKKLEDEFQIIQDKLEEKEQLTIRDYNDLLKIKLDKKNFERTEIVPLENNLFLLEILKENPKFYNDFEKNYITWFRDSQPFFGLYRNLQRGVFCPTSSMMDAMDNCSLKYNATEPKEVGTTYSETIYEGGDSKISFGGVVLNYNQNEELTAKLYYTLDCSNIGGCVGPDIMTINTMPIKVSISEDLKARTAYKSVVNMIKTVYDTIPSSQRFEGVKYIQEMWKSVQYQYNKDGFNNLLSATALKTMGDYLQECQAVFKWGGYVNNTASFPEQLKSMSEFAEIENKLIYRSVNKNGAIVPYDENTGNGLRLGIQGDRPSGFRSIYMLLNGEGDVNDQAITGYMFTSSTQNPSRTLLVARNSNNGRNPNTHGLKGSVIYVTRELQIQDRNALLESLEYLNVKDKDIKVSGEVVYPEITARTIIGSEDVTGQLEKRPIGLKPKPLKNSNYEAWIDYNDDFITMPAPSTQKKSDKKRTEIEEERETRIDNFEKKKGLTPEQKKAKKDADDARKKAEKEAIDARKKAEKEANDARKKAEKEAEAIIKAEAQVIGNASENIPGKGKGKGKGKQIAVTTEILNMLKPRLQELNIASDIFDIIYDKIENEERLSKQADEILAQRNTIAAEKKEKERKNKELIKIYTSSEEGQKLLNDIAEIEKYIQQLTSDIKQLQKTEKRGQPISPENVNQINLKQNEIREKEEEINKIYEEINTNAGIIKGGSYTRTNRKQYKHKLTKRARKNVNKLTKRHKKIKIPRKTKKNI